jgi:hypothetical protein
MNEITVRPKSSWQKSDCLYCIKESSHELVYKNISLRTCNSEKCNALATQLIEKLIEDKIEREEGFGLF